MKNNFYITTTLPYVNADPHIGFAREIIEADVLARYHRNIGDEVFFNTGVDEHGQKIYEKAKKLGKDVKVYCDEMAPAFDKMKTALNLSYDNFVRTTDKSHVAAAQEFWKLCDINGDIYKKDYKIKYCVGCELEKTDSELVDGKCPLHSNMELEIREEENYFFRFSKYKDKLLELYKNNPDFVLPKKRLNEIKNFIEKGPEDFSISRLKSKMPWGVPVPDDSEHIMYVWFDALVNYISVLGWPEGDKFKEFWPGYQVCGKDNLRQQAAMWQAMLMSAGIQNSKQAYINGFIAVNGQKMSKSQGNIISPFEMVEKFGVDATRYLLLSLGGFFGEDTDVSWEKFTEKYNADLANGLGNLLSRVITLVKNSNDKFPFKISNNKFQEFFNEMELGQALEYVWKIISDDNKFIGDNKPWELVKINQDKFEKVMAKLLEDLNLIADHLFPFMPETSEKIKKALETKKVEPLFQRIK